ncbi:hypothetical protein ACLKA7_008784 [Drosophila subpalustris]
MTTTITSKSAQQQQQRQQQQQQQQQTGNMNGFRITGYPAAATPPTRPGYSKPNAHELDLHISESLLYPGSTQQQQSLQSSPGPPPQLTNMLPPGAATPIALKGNNPFLNSPSPTDAAPTVAGKTTATATTSSGYEMPEYAEPSRLRGLKQRPHSIAVSASTASPTSATGRGFVDYNAQQQQRLLHLSRQQQQLRNAVSLVSTTTTATTATAADKESLYAAIFQQYRQSPTNGQPAPPVPMHRKPAAAGAVTAATVAGVPAVPRRSQSTPRPNGPAMQQQQQQMSLASPINGQLNGNGVQRPRSLDRYNGGMQATEAPPIPLRRFANGNSNNSNINNNGNHKKSSSTDNMLQAAAAATATCNVQPTTSNMRHSLSFQESCQENGKTDARPSSYAAPGAAAGPDQAYLEHQLRAYSEQLRTITESVRKYSEQAKLLSELKRQQQLAKQSQTNLNLLTPNSNGLNGNNGSNNSCNGNVNGSTNTNNNNFQPNMISPEIVSKSLASLSGAGEVQTPSNQLRLFLDNIRSSMRQEYQQHMPDDVLKPTATTATATLKRNSEVAGAAVVKPLAEEPPPPPTPSDQLRQFLDAIRANKIPENADKPKLSNSQTLDSFISKPLQMPDVTSGTPGGGGGAAATAGIAPPATTTVAAAAAGVQARRRPKSSVLPGGSNSNKLEQREHSLVTSESFHQISDNLRLMSEDLQALSPSKVVSSSASSGSLKTLAANGNNNSLTTELRVITSSPQQQMVMSKSNSSLGSLALTVTTPSSATTTPSTAPLMTDFNEILDSFHAMADKYKSNGSYDYLRKCSEALRQHSLQLKLQQQQQQQQQQQHQQQHQQHQLHQQQLHQQQLQNGFNSDDSSSCSTTPGSIRDAVQNLLLLPRNGFQILDDRMRLFIDIIDSQDRLSQQTPLGSIPLCFSFPYASRLSFMYFIKEMIGCKPSDIDVLSYIGQLILSTRILRSIA